jgi:hypothetical protein
MFLKKYGPDAEETAFFPEQETPVNWRVDIHGTCRWAVSSQKRQL